MSRKKRLTVGQRDRREWMDAVTVELAVGRRGRPSSAAAEKPDSVDAQINH